MRLLGDFDLAEAALHEAFPCCHPALSPDAQVALTLREVCARIPPASVGSIEVRPIRPFRG